VTTTAETYAMLGNDTLWDAAQQCHRALQDAAIPHALVGGVAVCLYGYQRNTVDVDILICREHTDAIKTALLQAGFTRSATEREFRSAAGIPVQCLLAWERAGKDSEIKLPDPSAAGVVTEREGLPVLHLAALIEAKLACGLGDLRRTHKDFADVVELIAIHELDSSFARHLHKATRPAFRQLVRNARGS
jgi:hypothetical protein